MSDKVERELSGNNAAKDPLGEYCGYVGVIRGYWKENGTTRHYRDYVGVI